ncbi:40S ribosomal protein S15a-5 [Citrus sinensis]|uniref:40S ribosomal protein S15a-5 n=1 Tax=Citrus sinensis TaxID=2711 RepID=A0ACB8IJ31_CITSI|nr:40S ribosomal protein S15a-5 [Citrus sinensis]
MGRRILNDALRAIVNAERRGKATVELQPISTDFQVYDPHRVGKIKVELLGRDVKAREIEGYTVRALPTRQVLGLCCDNNSGWCFGS